MSVEITIVCSMKHEIIFQLIITSYHLTLHLSIYHLKGWKRRVMDRLVNKISRNTKKGFHEYI